MTIALQPLYSFLRRLASGNKEARVARLARARYARAVAELSAWSDRELADIGLHRAQIAHAVHSGRPGLAADLRPSCSRQSGA